MRKEMYMVTGHHNHGFVAEYPVASSAAEAKALVMSELREMAKPWRIKRVTVAVYMTADELEQYGGAE